MGFTRKHKDHEKDTSYATASQVRTIRKKMREVMTKEGSGVSLDGLVEKLMIEAIGKEIEKHTNAVYPLQNCYIRKVKMLRTPKIDAGKLLEAHGGAEALAKASAASLASNTVVVGGADTGVKVDDKDAKADAKAAAPKKGDDKKAEAKGAKKDDAKAAKKDDKKDAKADKKDAAAKPKADGKAAKGGDKKAGGDAKKGGDKGKKKMDTSDS